MIHPVCRSRAAPLNLPNCGRVEKTERRSKTHVGDSESPLFIHQRAALFLTKKGWCVDPRGPRKKIETYRPRYGLPLI